MNHNATSDDVREALFDVLDQHQPVNEDYCACGAGYGPAHLGAALIGDRQEFGVFDVPSFEVRPRGTAPAEQISDAEVEAAWNALPETPFNWEERHIRAALEAAREVRNAAHR